MPKIKFEKPDNSGRYYQEKKSLIFWTKVHRLISCEYQKVKRLKKHLVAENETELATK